MKIKTRSDKENFLLRPVEKRNQLEVLLNNPNLVRLKTNHSYAQRTVQNRELTEETMKVPQLPKKRSKQFKMGIKVDTSWFSQVFPKWGETRNGATSFLKFPTDFLERIPTNVNQMRNVQENELSDLENQMKQAEFASCHLVDFKVAIDSLLKGNRKTRVWKKSHLN